MDNQVSTKEFLALLFGKCTDGCITITTLPDAKTEHIPVQQLDKAAELIAAHGRTSLLIGLHSVRFAPHDRAQPDATDNDGSCC